MAEAVLQAWHPLRAVAPFKMDLDSPSVHEDNRALPNATFPGGLGPKDSALG